MGGHFGAVTLKRARKFMAQFAPDMQIEEALENRRLAYAVTDAYRPGYAFTGRTPRKAMLAAGVYYTEVTP